MRRSKLNIEQSQKKNKESPLFITPILLSHRGRPSAPTSLPHSYSRPPLRPITFVYGEPVPEYPDRIYHDSLFLPWTRYTSYSRILIHRNIAILASGNINILLLIWYYSRAYHTERLFRSRLVILFLPEVKRRRRSNGNLISRAFNEVIESILVGLPRWMAPDCVAVGVGNCRGRKWFC